MKKQNEQNACEAFIEILYNLTGTQYVNRESPDEMNRDTPDVDFILASMADECDTIAVEHTIIESFEGQIGYVNRSYDIIGSINENCRNKIPDDRYYFIAIPPELAQSLTGENRKRFMNDFTSWVAETAPRLVTDKSARIDFGGHNITLMCRGSHQQLNGNVWGMPQQPESYKILRAQRLNRAIADKLPKLVQYKNRDITTALLLEDIASIPSIVTMNSDERSRVGNTIDYIVVFASNEGRMIVGNVWKEKSVWHSSVPYDRRFSFCQKRGKETLVENIQ
jgi:hypothetical protein